VLIAFADRELKFIPPKGRPVKQCEHCRTARKSKSHHAKCDCGSKKEKKSKEKAESPPVVPREIPSPIQAASPSSHDSGCYCHDGDPCTCGSKPETAEMRQVRRTPQPVRSRPSLTTSSSETKLMTITNGHHAPCHRNNMMAHTSGAPYPTRKKNRPLTIHGHPSSDSLANTVKSPNLSYATDDLHLDISSNRDFLIDSSANSISEENLSSGLYDNTWTFDPISTTRQISESGNRSSVDFASINTSISLSWPDLSPTRTESAFPHLHALGTSPNFDYPDSHTFQPSDLPIVSPQAATFSQALTQDDYGFAHAPGLTSNSSARSENDLWPENSKSDSYQYWSDTIQVRSNSHTALDHWAVESTSDLAASIAPSSTALYSEPKTTLSGYNDITSFEVSAQDESWLGNMGTEPQNISADPSSYFWDGQSYLSS
jgi:hypothetical protein